MNETINRISDEVAVWRKKEQDMRAIDPSSVNDPIFQRQKLEYFDRIAGKYKYQATPDEKLTMIYVNKVRGEIADQQLGRWQKLMRRIGIGIKEDKMSGEYFANRDENFRQISDQLKHLKIPFAATQVTDKMEQGLKQFSVPVSYYINQGERMDINLQYSRQADGSYALDSYRALLKNEQENRSRDHVVKPINGKFFDTDQAYNLLDGRSVMLNHRIALADEAINDQVWYKLDFNDKNASGEYRIKEFHSNFGFDLKRELGQINSRERLDPQELDRLAGILESGGSASVTVPMDNYDKTIILEADPQNRGFKFYIDQGGQAQQVSRDEALYDNHPATKLTHQQERPETQKTSTEHFLNGSPEKQPMMDGPVIPADHMPSENKKTPDHDILREKLIELGFEGSKDERTLSRVTDQVRGGERVEITLKTEDNNTIQMFVETDASKTQLNYFIHPRSFSYQQRQAESLQEIKKDDYKLQSDGRSPVLLEKNEQQVNGQQGHREHHNSNNRIRLDTERLSAIAERRKNKKINH